MSISIIDHGHSAHAEVLSRHIGSRFAKEPQTFSITIDLNVDAMIGTPESYRIDGDGNAWCITGSDSRGLYYGIGKFLHSAVWSEDAFAPKKTDGVVSPECPLRCIYFSVHCYNWYHRAEIKDMEAYLEDMLLYGYNTLHVIIPVLNFHSFEDDVYQDALKRTRAVFQAAKRVGMDLMFGVNPNQGLLSAPHEFDADLSYEPRPERPYRGTAGRNLCPNKPGAFEYLRGIWMRCLEEYEDIGLDYVLAWPYDEGGCGCEKCRPWGAVGFDKLNRVLARDARRIYPNIKFVYCTWTFDIPNDQQEYSTLYKKMAAGEMEYVDYLMTDAHRDFPRYVVEHPVIKPIINFPEISMWGLFPWGGFGANPLPKRFEAIWDSSKAVLSGGDPYSEGLFEDISKVQFAGYYWKKDARYTDILREYASYEFGNDVAEDAVRIMELIEENHVSVGKAVDTLYEFKGHEEDAHLDPSSILRLEPAVEARRLAESVDSRMSALRKASWRWRILYIRAVLDEKRYRLFFEKNMKCNYEDLHDLRHDCRERQLLKDDPEAQAMYQELRDIFCTLDHDNGKNKWTLPVVQ